MCFTVTERGKELKAKRDIKVYKVIYETGESIYFDHVYEPGERQLDIRLIALKRTISFTFLSICDIFEIEKGYHSYTTLKKALANKAFAERMFRTVDLKIALFTIPKGAKYYVNRFHGERVSSTIIFNKFLSED